MANTVVANTSAGLSGETLLTDPVDLTSQVTGQLPSANLPDSGVTANTYGDSTHVAQVTVNAKGIVTGVSNAVISSSGATISTGAEAAIPAFGTAGNLYLPNDGYWLQRDSGAAWVPWGPIYPMTPPIDGDFAWVNQGGASVVTANGGIFLRAPAVASANYRIKKKAAPATPYTVTAAITPMSVALNYQQAGILFRQSSDGKFVTFGLEYATAGVVLAVYKYTGVTAFSASYTSRGFLQGQQPIWLRITDDGTNRICSWSMDGQNFIQFHSVGRTDFITADEVGFYCNDSTNTYDAGNLLLSWKET